MGVVGLRLDALARLRVIIAWVRNLHKLLQYMGRATYRGLWWERWLRCLQDNVVAKSGIRFKALLDAATDVA